MTLLAATHRQRRLLDLQALDTRLDQIAHRKATLPEGRALQERASALAELNIEVVRVQTAHGDVQREVTKAETGVELVRNRSARNQARLDSGQGSPKDLQALQHEIGSLARRQAELEEIELEVMERAESLEHELAALRGARDAMALEVDQLAAARDSAVAVLDEEAAGLRAARAELLPEIGEDLLVLYEKVRSASGGVGAAALQHRRCEGCRLELNQVDLGRIAAAAPDEVVRCEECRRILVRTPESGV